MTIEYDDLNYLYDGSLTSSIATASEDIKDAVTLLNVAIRKAHQEGIKADIKILEHNNLTHGVTPVVIVTTYLRL